ncbi:MAG: hypothetical protein U0797_25990 [Gemmataceae bacterium]
MRLLCRFGLFLGLAAAVVGCSQSRLSSKVTGRVTYKSQPVKAGLIFLAYQEGGKYQAALQSDGSYQFVGLPVGSVKVFIENEAFDPDQKPKSYTGRAKSIAAGVAKGYSEYNRMSGGGEKAGTKSDDGTPLTKEKREELAKVYVKLPKKYTAEKTTPLSFTVESGRQTKDFDLTDD